MNSGRLIAFRLFVHKAEQLLESGFIPMIALDRGRTELRPEDVCRNDTSVVQLHAIDRAGRHSLLAAKVRHRRFFQTQTLTSRGHVRPVQYGVREQRLIL